MTTAIRPNVNAIARSVVDGLMHGTEATEKAARERIAMQLDGYGFQGAERVELTEQVLARALATLRDRVGDAFKALERVSPAEFDRMMSAAPVTATTPVMKTGPLTGKTLTIVGSGPGGLLTALHAADAGAKVRVFDRRKDPRVEVFTDARSYNLSLNAVGLAALGPYASSLVANGLKAVGRAVHDGTSTRYYPYGQRKTDHFYNLPREEIIRTLAEHAGRHPNIELHYEAGVQALDGRKGTVTVSAPDGVTLTVKSDLIVAADGTSGVGRDTVARIPGVSTAKEVVATYLNVRLPRERIEKHNMSREHIHFFPSPGGVALGVPLRDGSIDFIMVGKFPGDPDKPAFRSVEEARAQLAKDWPNLLALDPELMPQLLATRTRGQFVVTRSTRHNLGAHGVMIGDAARSMPPWVAFGANASLNDAATLVRTLVQHADAPEAAVAAYDAYQNETADALRAFAKEHGKMVQTKLGGLRWRFTQWLNGLKERHFGSRTLYQCAEMEPNGLELLRRWNSANRG